MRYDFSAQFLRVLPPDTSFAEAWESLCFILLKRELEPDDLLHLSPPDCGIDILNRTLHHAYQCKCVESGSTGTINPKSSISSLRMAVRRQESFLWEKYSFAVNAPFSGTGIAKILGESERLGLASTSIGFLGPDYWDQLCIKYSEATGDRFYYRVSLSELQLLEALEALAIESRHPTADQLLEYNEDLESVLTILNDQTKLELEVPFAKKLRVETLAGILRAMLFKAASRGVNFVELGTSAFVKTSLSLDGKELDTETSLEEMGIAEGNSLNLSLEIETRPILSPSAQDVSLIYRELGLSESRAGILSDDREDLTRRRMEALLQDLIWNSAKRLKPPLLTAHAGREKAA